MHLIAQAYFCQYVKLAEKALEYINKWAHIYFRNFNPDKTVQEKIKEIRKVKGVKGLKILLKEVVSSAAARKHDNKLIGSAFIPLKVWLLKKQYPLIK